MFGHELDSMVSEVSSSFIDSVILCATSTPQAAVEYPGCRAGVFLLGSPVARCASVGRCVLPHSVSSGGGSGLWGFEGRAMLTALGTMHRSCGVQVTTASGGAGSPPSCLHLERSCGTQFLHDFPGRPPLLRASTAGRWKHCWKDRVVFLRTG